MPELALFFEITVRVYAELGTPHHEPHFHAYYQDDVAILSIDPVEVVAGSLPRRQLRLAMAWAELHQEELMKDWELLQSGRKPIPIAPLR